MYFEISMIIAPMLDKAIIAKNSVNVIGTISSHFPNGGINIDEAIIIKELKTARTSHLFLNSPTFIAGYIVERHAKAW